MKRDYSKAGRAAAKNLIKQFKEPKIKPCPFCGGKATIIRSAYGDIACGCVSGECVIAPLTDYGDCEEKAIRAWNRRVIS